MPTICLSAGRSADCLQLLPFATRASGRLVQKATKDITSCPFRSGAIMDSNSKRGEAPSNSGGDSPQKRQQGGEAPLSKGRSNKCNCK